MAIRTVSIFQVAGGKREEFLKESEQAKAIATRLGARFRLGEMIVGGGQTGQMVVPQEFDDLAAYGAFTQKRAADREWQELGDQRPPGPWGLVWYHSCSAVGWTDPTYELASLPAARVCAAPELTGLS